LVFKGVMIIWLIRVICACQSDSRGLFGLCALSLCLHEGVIVILSPVSLSLLYIMMVIFGLVISLGVFGLLGFLWLLFW
jgi:hypothetical protein